MDVQDYATPAIGILYIVGTPIGNLEDMTFRAIRILQIVDAIAAEDTRHTGKLLHHFQIKTPQISYHQHNIQSRIPQLIERLQRGENLALVTDAGMPCISDPGYELVKACAEASIQVIPIPGPTAAITALAASGLPSDRFCFEGFLPAKGKIRREHLAALQQESRTLIFYEAPHRLRQTLQDFAETVGTERVIVISRELTKLHETFWRGTVAEAICYFQQEDPRGEYTLILAGAERLSTIEPTETEIIAALQTLLGKGISRSQASKEIAQLLNLSRREVYQLTLTLGEGKDDGEKMMGRRD
jgi:16S rRNA (cytidine1402-2'-O)-methyltransferase